LYWKLAWLAVAGRIRRGKYPGAQHALGAVRAVVGAVRNAAARGPAGGLMSARLSVDEARCTGHGRCYDAAPGLLSDDEEGFVTLRGRSMEVPDGHLGEARLAVAACPERAVRLEQDS
jgi:ferredoxin